MIVNNSLHRPFYYVDINVQTKIVIPQGGER